MLDPTAEQLAFAAAVRRLLARQWPPQRTRELLDAGGTHDPAAWKHLADLGAVGLLVPAAFGGAGAGPADAGLVCIELGRVLLPSPYLSSAVLAARLLTALDDEAAMARYLPGIASGDTIATVAFLDARGLWSPTGPAVTAQPYADARRGGTEATHLLAGTAPYVTDATCADIVFVVAAGENGPGVYAVENAAARLRPEPLVCLDPTMPLSRLPLHGVPAVRIGAGAQVAAVMADVADTALACLVALGLGSAERCLEMSRDYACTRVQFGRAIGSFQAVKHRCADLFIRVESARSAAYHALHAADTALSGASPAERAAAVGLAKAYTAEAYVGCAADTIQLHGGIGFTWEHDAHLHLRRAMLLAHLLGDAVHHRTALLAEATALLAEAGRG